ncbi:VanZ family protein [Nocardioides marinus]|uniref:Glycopeptide antibiotics resistance protein n=1 Tax=Nocardioides marinus TaxID=374514 RepID=A0A7Z0C682_9ACTN|nr:glycopeptide antibiotics resistance protein [Nocardioides marinus]
MSDQALNALTAVALGGVVAVVLFIPVAAYEYRRDGRLGAGDLTTLITGAVYGLSLWTYTLLPLPDRGEFRCRVPQSDLLGTIGLMGFPDDGVRVFLRDPAVQQVLLNVLLFVPLGVFVRLVLRRGVVVATLTGLAVSFAIEMTQRTGVWGFYDCAYRKFDVDDLLVNTLGALAGALLSWPVLRRRSDTPAPLPTRVTWGRRMAGMLSDALFVLMLGGAVAVAWRGLMFYVLDTGPHRAEQWLLQWSVPFAVEALCVLGLGRTVGEIVVSVRTESPRRWWTGPGRLLKLALGIGPVFWLVLAPIPYRGQLLAAYLVLTVVATFWTREHRGLSHALAGLELRVAVPPGAQPESVAQDADRPAEGSTDVSRT